MDTQLRVITAQMLNCLCAAVSGNPNPPQHCRFQVEWEVPQDLFPTDLCCEGIAYLSMGEVWPSSASFPEQDIIQQIRGNCPPPAWAVEFRLGIMRCVPGAELAPSAEDEEEAFLQDLDDSQALRSAACCIRDYLLTDPQWLGFNTVIERQVKTVQGNCKDRYQPLTIQIPNCDC
jgi:hypothetical protein